LRVDQSEFGKEFSWAIPAKLQQQKHQEQM